MKKNFCKKEEKEELNRRERMKKIKRKISIYPVPYEEYIHYLNLKSTNKLN